MLTPEALHFILLTSSGNESVVSTIDQVLSGYDVRFSSMGVSCGFLSRMNTRIKIFSWCGSLMPRNRRQVSIPKFNGSSVSRDKDH